MQTGRLSEESSRYGGHCRPGHGLEFYLRGESERGDWVEVCIAPEQVSKLGSATRGPKQFETQGFLFTTGSGPTNPAETENVVSKAGLTTYEAGSRLAKSGPNAMPDTSAHPIRVALDKFWAPVPWMLEAAIVVELTLGKYVELTEPQGRLHQPTPSRPFSAKRLPD